MLLIYSKNFHGLNKKDLALSEIGLDRIWEVLLTTQSLEQTWSSSCSPSGPS